MSIRTADEVAEALAANAPVVALESTIFSPFGLPAPANEAALDRCIAAIRANGAVPAVTAVLDGEARVGLDVTEHERILTGGHKVAERELAIAMSRGTRVGVTTVSASLALAAAVGIEVFATGGIGGVHRGAEITGDVSADLGAIAAFPVVTVSSGAKAFLDLARTLEALETASVPVLGWRTDDFPMFWCRSSGLRVPQRVEEAAEVAGVLRALRALGLQRGVLLAVPIPERDAIDPAAIEVAIAVALSEGESAGERGAAVTPRILAAIAEATEGRTVAANLTLAEHNAEVAAQVAKAFTQP